MTSAGKGWKIQEYAGDALLVLEAREAEELLALAAVALRELICPELDEEPGKNLDLQLEATDLEGLLVAWLNELLYLFETRQLLWGRAQVHLIEGLARLHAKLPVLEFDPTRHQVDTVVKSATHHKLKLTRDTDGLWRTRVVLDL